MEINFVEEPKYKLITEDGYKAADVIKNISRMDPSKQFVKGKTLILIPIEVKAVNGRAKSLRTLISSDKYEDTHYGIKFTGGNIGYENGIYTFPYFCAFLLKRYLRGKV